MDFEFDPTLGGEPKQERTAAGTLGALLGSLAGVVCIVLIGRLNAVASASGLVMAVCALKGYEKLAGTLSKKGAAISCAIILIMTYFAHHLDITIEIVQELGMSLPDAFLSIPKLLRLEILDKAVFWGNLALLYLFTLLGAVPTIRRSLAPPVPQYPAGPMNGMQPGPAGSAPAAPMSAASADGAAADGAAAQEQAAQAEFFPPDRNMTARPRYGGLIIALLFFAAGIVLFALSGAYVSPVLTGMVLIVCALFLFCGAMVYVPDTTFLFARVNETLWRINLEQLNNQPGYHFTNSSITLTGARWHKLSSEEQQRAKICVQHLIAAINSAQSRQYGSLEDVRGAGGFHAAGSQTAVALCLQEAVLLKETRWAWKLSYLANHGKRRRLTVHKSYPGLAPAAGCQPAGRPVPFRWRGVLVSLIFILLFGGLFLAVDITNASYSRPKQDDLPRTSAAEPDPRSAVSSSLSGREPASNAQLEHVEITWDNYQSLFHLASEQDYRYIAVGYLPAPAEAFGENRFVEAYVPYCDAPAYSEDGATLTAGAHGMQIEISIVPTEGDARDAVATMYDAFAASGADLYENGISETEFSEEYGVAVKQVFYFEQNHTLPRMSLFYADKPVNGHCYAARITYLLEQQDEDYPALLQELGDVFGLSLPEMEPFEP